MTKIEWTHVPDGKGGFKKGETLNHQIGCKEVSPACRRCYAAKLAHRGMSKQHKGLTVMRETGGVHWNGEVNRVPDALVKPLHWREPRGVFVGSMTDVFFDVSTEDACRWIAALFGVMAATPRHTYMLLTKRPENAARWFAWIKDALAWGERDRGEIAVLCEALCEQAVDWPKWVGSEGDGLMELLDDAEWPLPNVWVGVTAEDQQRADERVPVLLTLPAAIRFVSYEPALGPVDWTKIRPVALSDGGWAPGKPTAPYFNALAGCWTDGLANGPASTMPRIDQIIAGGESGPRARPSYPDWFRSTRDQCVEAGTALFFKQWGEWAEVGDQANDVAGSPGALRWTHMVSRATGRVYASGEEMPMSFVSEVGAREAAFMCKVGKKLAGRELDGRTWDEFPGGHDGR